MSGGLELPLPQSRPATRADVSGSNAVMANRDKPGRRPRVSDGQPWQDYELFPTPPWATRALFAHVLPSLHVGPRLHRVWEPCAGLGHMSEVLAEFSDDVWASDIYNYELSGPPYLDTKMLGIETADFFLAQADTAARYFVITNPPFSEAARMARHALTFASGSAFLLRLQWLETLDRYRLFADCPPSRVAVFSERVPMCEGGLDPKQKSATGYAWFVWVRSPYDGIWIPPARRELGAFDGMLIPPDCKRTLSRPGDRRLAERCVPGFVPPSQRDRERRAAAI